MNKSGEGPKASEGAAGAVSARLVENTIPRRSRDRFRGALRLCQRRKSLLAAPEENPHPKTHAQPSVRPVRHRNALVLGLAESLLAGKLIGAEAGAAAKGGFDRNAIIRGFQDHHIISDKNALTKSHELLDLAGFDLQSRANKMFLPSDAALHPTRSIPSGKHWNSVSQNLAEQMDAVVQFGRQNGWSQAQYDQALRAIVSQERQLLRSGERALNRNARPGAQ